LQNARLIINAHHERWDGRGYPRGLSGPAIPLQARIMAIVDVYDALISKRSYKNALAPEEAIEIIMQGAGNQFDPYIAESFFQAKDLLVLRI
jgi:putative two-component system response regulator